MIALSQKDMEIIRRTPLFGGLSDAVLQRLLKDARVISEKRGKLLFMRGDVAERFFLLLEGWLKLFRDTPEGEQTVLAVFKPGDTVAEAAMFMERAYPASAEVVDDARLLVFPAQPFLTALREDSEVALKMLGALSKRLRGMVFHIEQLHARSTPQRLGGFLLTLSESVEGASVVRLPYDKSLVAARLGMKPES
ncbi:MAG TPA: Crp/Fnr family transcriptional regulator, partial [Rhodospirillales bacterium]|nr:Crp/Fnr family transcriptional regulator [Rhodospirillales bacterium]